MLVHAAAQRGVQADAAVEHAIAARSGVVPATKERALVACTGASTKLPADQCAAWQDFWDGAGGAGWTNYGAGCSRTDPCASSCGSPYPGYPTCNEGGTSIVRM